MHRKLPQSTVKLALPSNERYESKTGCNRTLATVLWVPLISVAIGAAIYRSLHTPEPRNPQKVSKGGSRASRPGVSKKCRKVPNNPKKSQKDYKISVRGLFRHFFDTPGREAREVLFETFWGFRGSGVWRLLYMGLAHARLVATIHMSPLPGEWLTDQEAFNLRF